MTPSRESVSGEPRSAPAVTSPDVVATYRLPFAIAFDEGCSGNEARTRLGSVDARVVLPRLSWDDDTPLVAAPLAPADAVLDLGDDWGEVGGWDPNARTVDGWWAKGLVFKAETASLGVDATIEGLFAALGSWTNRLAGWIEAIGDQDAGRMGPLRNVGIDGEGLAIWVDGDVLPSSASTPEMPVLSHAAVPLDPESWQLILREVGDGSEVPDEHALLSDARAWFRREDYRRSIIDAAAAAELVLAEILDWKFAAAPPAVENQFPLERRTLGPLKDLLAPLVPVSKERLDRLVMTRNAVMHKSYVATSSEASEAVAVAEELVALIYPIDALLGR